MFFVSKAKKPSKEEKEAEKLELQKILSEAQPLQKASFLFVHQKIGVANSKGRLTFSSLNKKRAYVAFDVVQLDELMELVNAGLIKADHMGL